MARLSEIKLPEKATTSQTKDGLDVELIDVRLIAPIPL